MFPVLGIETTGELCSSSVLIDEKRYVEKNICMKNIHSEKLITMIEDIISEANLKPKELRAIAISNGPGSFTGLRIGMATAKGIAFASDIPIISVPTLEALALQICNYLPEKTEFVIVNNVNIEEVFYAKFKKEKNSYITISEKKIVAKKGIQNYLKENELIFGNYSGLNNIVNISAPNSLSVVRWAITYGKKFVTTNYDYLEPNYIKNFVAKVKK